MSASDDPNQTRKPVTLKIKFKSRSIDTFIERYGRDLSRDWIFIRTPEPLAVGTAVRFELQLQDGRTLLSGEGTVLRHRGLEPVFGSGAAGMEVRFDQLTPESQLVLARILSGIAERVYGQDAMGMDPDARFLGSVGAISMGPPPTGPYLAPEDEPIRAAPAASVVDRSAESFPPTGRLQDGRVEGWLGVDAPTELPLAATAMVRAVAIQDLLAKALVEQALPQANRQLAQEKLAPVVSVDLVPLSAGAFAVRPLSPRQQPVRPDELTVWEWLITAQRPGAAPGEDQILLLTVTNLLDASGHPLEKALPARQLRVRVSGQHRPGAPIFTTDGLRQIVNTLADSDGELGVLCAEQLAGQSTPADGEISRAAALNRLLAYVAPQELIHALRARYPATFEEVAARHALPVAAAPAAASAAGAAPGPPQRSGTSAIPTPLEQKQGPNRWPGRSGNWTVAAAGLALLCSVGYWWAGQPPRTALPESTVELRVSTAAQSAAGAAARGLAPLPSAPSADPQEGLGTSYAVLFATTRYDDRSWPPLATPESDARDIAEELRTLYGFDVVRKDSLTVQELRKTIRQLAERKYAYGDQLFLLFSGHGDKDDTLKKGWIIARDSRAEDRQSAYPFSELREDIDNIPCRHILVVLDVCFGGSFDPSLREAQTRAKEYVETSADAFIRRKLRYRSRLYVSSVDQQTEAPEGRGHSPFAWKLLEALRSGGGSDGVLTWNELVGYLEKLTPEPRGGVFPRSPNSDPGGDFLFVVKRPAR